MQFYTLAYALFLMAALAVYYLVGRFVRRGQWVVLLVASLSFYAFSGWQNFAFIGVTALSTWVGGLAFAHFESQSKAARKQVESRDEKKAIKRRFTRKKRLVLLAMLLLGLSSVEQKMAIYMGRICLGQESMATLVAGGVAEGVWGLFNLLPAAGFTLALIILLLFYKLRSKDVQTMSRYNNGEISREEAEELLGARYGSPAK